MSETNAQLRLIQIVNKKKVQLSGHVGEVRIVNFSDGTKVVEFHSKDGEIEFTLVTNEPFGISMKDPPLVFVEPEVATLFPYWAIKFKAYLRCKKPSHNCLTCDFLKRCQALNEVASNLTQDARSKQE
jgi:hypothetical protein